MAVFQLWSNGTAGFAYLVCKKMVVIRWCHDPTVLYNGCFRRLVLAWGHPASPLILRRQSNCKNTCRYFIWKRRGENQPDSRCLAASLQVTALCTEFTILSSVGFTFLRVFTCNAREADHMASLFCILQLQKCTTLTHTSMPGVLGETTQN